MDALAAEIAKKKAQLGGGGGGGGKRRWVKTASLDAERRSEVESKAAKRGRAARPTAAAAAGFHTTEVTSTPRPRSTSTDDAAALAARVAARVDALADADDGEVARRLRERGAPICMFGEDRRGKRLRLAGLEATQTVKTDDDFKLAGAYATKNVFLDDKGGAGGATPRSGGGGAGGDNESESEDESPEKKRRDDDAPVDPHKRLRRWIRFQLKAWEASLVARPAAAKRTPVGRVETKTYKQCKDYIRPLIKLCKRKCLDPGLRSALVKMVDYCDDGEFVLANDAYILVAIGNAAWPIGVTSVGIHTRTAREAVEQKNVAHVMNNESQRKYLTSVKRLMKFAQDARPDVAPSKKVL